MNIIFESIRLRNNYLWSKERLERSAVTDTLTRLYNRVGLENYKKDFIDESLITKKPLLVLVADMNGLKIINDTFGHMDGDFAISYASRAFRTHKTGTEKCFRFGGDEFIMLGVGDYTEESVRSRMESIKKFLYDYNEKGEKPFLVELSLGYHLEVYDGSKTIDQYISEADIMMYQDKKNSKGDIIR
ncbi:MAG: GGDEF domain-containing protein [Erysipelotrichaceae bacterium]|nr:GGDEF domain-containing protein [Erysipelotrichaceae bacterium]